MTYRKYTELVYDKELPILGIIVNKYGKEMAGKYGYYGYGRYGY